ncbi:MAG: hypothetical protein Q9227_006589 [Pyrenula ochraceoflavens]
MTAQTITAPIGAAVMAVILYTYSVASIRAAKRNAQLHREADGGQVDMRKESLRRHGVMDRVEGTSSFQLLRASRKNDAKEREHMGANKATKVGEEVGENKGPGRSEIEDQLGSYKGPRGSQEIVQKVLAQERAEREKRAG